MSIKKNDNVIVTTGQNRLKQGKVLRVFRDRDQVLIEGVNLKKKHQRPRKEGEKGQMIEVPHPIHLSNIALYCPSCGRGVKSSAKIMAMKSKKDLPAGQAGKKTRVCRKCGKEI
ncbi:MAG: 50S ribosomal protein L24 [Candidatus Vogelbacteria bacterium CG10_big_fil_rev_8_21_14_0_10_49_38]|uniref:Large ribosomal subunit protein uL24 n=1 Tax=Candidatus Vogelbacteria bacterium CG10_big_fil_rev_8_21_14_0_10_49_38 TaxID=1975043 RepID=A0A2H0RIU9_9BACT|nr:MAG: 50S ribosomal protein L24 [bacterium CG10_49_38]PIR46387.1 MAG: 50S ribosomal protein L24 [Candidatus Vogelbacteria bacterium CG10_big_fil_rev_8_21_14_0_10_49_38]